MPSSRISDVHLREYSDLAESWMQQYLRIDTTNPPGNELRGVEFFKKILDDEGIENRVFEISPGRGDPRTGRFHRSAESCATATCGDGARRT